MPSQTVETRPSSVHVSFRHQLSGDISSVRRANSRPHSISVIGLPSGSKNISYFLIHSHTDETTRTPGIEGAADVRVSWCVLVHRALGQLPVPEETISFGKPPPLTSDTTFFTLCFSNFD